MNDTATHLIPISDLSRELMLRTFQKQVPALPFARDLFLLETHVAGLAHYQVESVSDQLLPGAPLLLQREPGNEHDALAIEVLTPARIKLGYVPQNRNPILARLMDAGKLLVADICTVGTWHGWGTPIQDVRLRICLRE